MDAIKDKIETLHATEVLHVFLCGLRGSGKTLLLYKTLMPDWDNAAAEIEPTTLYHYEQIKHRKKTLGLWDFSGDSMVKVAALAFVINAMESTTANNFEITTWIECLLQEQTMQTILVILVFNGNAESMIQDKIKQFELFIARLKRQYGNRFYVAQVSAVKGAKDPEWIKVLDFIATYKPLVNE